MNKAALDAIRAAISDRFSRLTWDAPAQAYVSPSGTPLPAKSVRQVVDEMVSAKGTSLQKLGEAWRDGTITQQEFRDRSFLELRRLHLQTGSVANGGLHQLDDVAYRRVEAKLKSEQGYLDGFIADYADEPGTINLARLDQYAQAGRNTYEVERQGSHVREGYQYERSVLHASDSCDECAALDMVWSPIGTTPMPGDRTCCRNCGCTMEYSEGSPDDMDD